MIIYNKVYIFVQRGALALLVSTIRAMREPLHCGASDQHQLHVLFVYSLHTLINNVRLWI